jgi:hypothetical protein
MARLGGWGENRGFLEGDKLEVAVKNRRWMPSPPTGGAAAGGRTSPTLFSGRLKRRCIGGDVVPETALQSS